MSKARAVVDFDQHGPFFSAHWREQLRDMRANMPLAWTHAHDGFWVITKYDDIVQIERDPKTFSCFHDMDGNQGGAQGIRIPPSPIRFSLNESDPPLHSKLRRLEAPFFSMRALEVWFELARELLDEHIDRIIEKGEGDFIHDITIPVPAQVTLRLVGVPMERWQDFMIASINSFLPTNHPDYPIAERKRIGVLLDELMEQRRAEPCNDVISALVNAQIDGQPMPQDAAKGMLQALLYGGFDTTAATAANALYWLEMHPELHGRLIEDDAFLEGAVDEFLRYFPPVIGGLARTVTQDVELRGQMLKAGERCLLMFASGNFDEERFERPEELWLERPNARQNLAFGAGPHRCLGSALGMKEVGIIIRGVLQRLPDYCIDRENAQPVPSLGLIYGWKQMPFRFTSGARKRPLDP